MKSPCVLRKFNGYELREDVVNAARAQTVPSS